MNHSCRINMVWEPDYEGNGLECDQLGDKVT